MKHQIKNFSLYDNSSKSVHPAEFDAFATVNQIARVFNYDIFAVSEKSMKDNPFQTINKDISREIKSMPFKIIFRFRLPKGIRSLEQAK